MNKISLEVLKRNTIHQQQVLNLVMYTPLIQDIQPTHAPVSSRTMKSEETMSSSNAVMIMETIGKQPYLLQPTTKPVFLDIKKLHVKIKKPDTMNEPSFPKQS